MMEGGKGVRFFFLTREINIVSRGNNEKLFLYRFITPSNFFLPPFIYEYKRLSSYYVLEVRLVKKKISTYILGKIHDALLIKMDEQEQKMKEQRIKKV